MKRREFITLLGGAAAWPLAARAQEPMPVIGFLDPRSPDGMTERLRGFRQGLKDTGYVDGENVTIEYRWAEGQNDRLPALADELVRKRVAVLAAFGIVATSAAMSATTTIPIVFAVAEDPVKHNLVASLARPGGNLTGINIFTTELVTKRLGLLRELVPGAVRVPDSEHMVRDVVAAARAMGLQIQLINASTSREINAAFASLVRERPDALFVGGEPFLNSRRVQLAHLASRHAVPATYALRDYVEVGGLMSYGPNIADAFRQAGVYTGRILKGAKPQRRQMKILSIRQPWAYLITRGSKDIENRSWPTKYRGPVIVHASLHVDRQACVEHQLDPTNLQTGGIVGMVDIVDCVTRHRSKWFEGPYGFVLKGRRALPFVEWRGALGLQNAPRRLLNRIHL